MIHTKFAKRSLGFTLVELAISLVVIAFLLTLVVRGTGLIDSAKWTAMVSTIKDLTAASRHFKERYRYWPGDLPNASASLPNLPAACNLPISTAFIGDGQINTATEVSCAIEELFQAGLIKADLDSITGLHTVTQESSSVRLVAGAASNVPNFLPGVNVVEIASISCATAIAVDQKIDDNDIALASMGRAKASVASCVSGGTNDPVPFFAAAMN